MDNDNGDVCNNQPPLGIHFGSFHFILFIFQVIFKCYNFYTLLYVFVCTCFLVLISIYNWFESLFITLKGRK